ncbi:uncharacterized protein PV09_08819 [Verruconis gallopava]|uniref:HECT-type E3 ubiquitin transferase n=1 Tax=Verruconis gallopava TaxID=253628 RepID=A0A0D2AKK9_9PEZI|nr:uncharacterized protein PV09_08819 [Verruconis gallopava]KIV99513.1 hypothetical protein PV09_08819 [Verruconis gallopava]
MFGKAFRALSSGSRDRDRFLEDAYLDRPSPRPRPSGSESTQRQLKAPVAFENLHVSDSDSDEYGLPQVRKGSFSRNDSHKRTHSREQAEVEIKCPGCGDLSRLKLSDNWHACRFCHVRPFDARRPQAVHPAPGKQTQKQLRTPRQLEESFRNMYRRLGVIVHDEGAEVRPSETDQVNNGMKMPPSHRAPSSAPSSKKPAGTRPSELDLNLLGPNRALSSSVPPVESPLRTPPAQVHPSCPAMQPASSRQGPSSEHPHGRDKFVIQNNSLSTPREPPRPVSRGSPYASHQSLKTSPRKRMPNVSTVANGYRGPEIHHSPKERAKQQLLECFQAEFRSLFGNVDFLNGSFCSSIRPKGSKRSMSEGSNISLKTNENGAVGPVLSKDDSEKGAPTKTRMGKPLPPIPSLVPDFPDSKTLLAGHIHDIVSSLVEFGNQRPFERSTTVAQKSTYQTSPHINYPELHAYHSILSRYTLDVDYCLTLVVQEGDNPDKRCSIKTEVVRFIGNLLSACFDVLFDVLTAAREEPKAPQGARYLLIILSTPWLLRPLTPLATIYRRWHDEQAARYRHEPVGRLEDEARLLLLDHPQDQKSVTSLRDRIIGLCLGRIANLSDTVQHVFARWFANMPVNIYVEITKTVQDFNLKQIKSIPVEQHSRTEETRQLHDRRFLSEMLGTTNIENFDNDFEALPWYSKKKSAWKLRTSCQVLQLLVVANDIKTDTASRYNSAHGKTRPSEDMYKPFPVDYFYTPLLDAEAGRLDVALDFELWDSRRGNFTMCQYPFLMTLGTKVRALEYDNERRKKDAVRQEWHASKGMSADPYFHLTVRRDYIIEDSFKVIRQAVGSMSKVTSKKLRVHFEGEEAVDAGGPQKEWFLILTEKLFDPELGLFYLSDSGYFWFNSACKQPNEYFELVGAVFGLAIYNQTSLFAPFPPFLFKKLAAAAPRQSNVGILWRHLWRPTLQDYAQLSPDFARVLKQGLEDPSVMEGLAFEIPVWQNGQSVYHALEPDGSNRIINAGNIDEFVEKAVSYVLQDSINNQFRAFARGFHSICGGNALSLFRGEELELLVRGSEDFDLETLRAAAVYDNWKRLGTDEDLQTEDEVVQTYPLVNMFWNYFQAADIKERRRILRFITGTDRLPPAGIVNLVIKISRQQMKKGEYRYPSARTCFNQILLPDCFEKQSIFDKVFKNALDMAGTGFGMK